MPLACMIQGVCLGDPQGTQWPENSRLLLLRDLLEWLFFDMVVRLGAAEWESHQGGWDTLGMCLHNSHTHSRLLYPLGHSPGSGPL